MQPASAGNGEAGDRSRALRRWGPIGAVVALVAVVAVVLVATSGGDDDDDDAVADASVPAASPAPATEAGAATTAPASSAATTTASAPTSETSTPSSAPAGSTPETGAGPATTGGTTGADITYPLSFSDAEEQGIDVSWDERCDTERGQVAVPDYFAPECYAPFEGDNGGATATGVTAESIKVVFYLAQEAGPDHPLHHRRHRLRRHQRAADRDDAERHPLLPGVLRDVRPHRRAGAVRRLRRSVRRGRGARRRRAHRRGDPAVRRLGWSRADAGLRGRARRAPGPLHRLRPRPAIRVLRAAGAVRLGHRRQPGPEAGPCDRVHPEAAHRRSRPATPATSSSGPSDGSGSCTSSAARRRSSSPNVPPA